jgi:Tol biopolymer transport system component
MHVIRAWRATALASLLPALAVAQGTAAAAPAPKRDLPLTPARSAQFTTSKGTWISLDVSPDGRTIVFDLLGDLYTMPIEGGTATRLTSGIAFDAQPRFSPDGRRVVFVSDRSGGDNVWIQSLDGRDTVQITKGNDNLVHSPTFTPDGRYVIASRSGGPLGGAAKLWMYHVDGGAGIQLIREPANFKTLGAAVTPDGKSIWFAGRTGDWQYNAILPQYQLYVFDRETGDRRLVSGRYGSAFRPALSRDGSMLVYGTRHDAETGLRLRDLRTGDERWLAYPVQRDEQESRAPLDVYPGYAFTPDSRSVVVSYGGEIWRVSVDSGTAVKIPFTANVDVPIGPNVANSWRVDDGATFTARQIRDAVPSPDGTRLAFTAAERLYVMDWPRGTPRRVTTGELTEAFPAWSPDGRSLAFSTWADGVGGQIMLARVEPRPVAARALTTAPAAYSGSHRVRRRRKRHLRFADCLGAGDRWCADDDWSVRGPLRAALHARHDAHLRVALSEGVALLSVG